MDDKLARSQAQEKRIAKRTGGSRNAGSGNGWIRKHDVTSDGVLWEMKTTNKRTLTLKVDDLESLRREAWALGSRPMMHLELGGRSYVLMEESDYFDIQDKLCTVSAPPVNSPASGTPSTPAGSTIPIT